MEGSRLFAQGRPDVIPGPLQSAFNARSRRPDLLRRDLHRVRMPLGNQSHRGQLHNLVIKSVAVVQKEDDADLSNRLDH